jgi:hypothetical protein
MYRTGVTVDPKRLALGRHRHVVHWPHHGDPPALDQHRLIGEYPLAVHWDHHHVDKRRYPSRRPRYGGASRAALRAGLEENRVAGVQAVATAGPSASRLSE